MTWLLVIPAYGAVVYAVAQAGAWVWRLVDIRRENPRPLASYASVTVSGNDHPEMYHAPRRQPR